VTATDPATTTTTDADLETFRRRCRSFLETHATGGLPGRDDDPRGTRSLAMARAFQREVAAAGLAGLTYPEEHGGRGLTPDHERIWREEASHFPLMTSQLAISHGMCLPMLAEFGTEEQQRRYLARLISAEEVWCQMFSEPGAGSDVASLQTRAVRDGDEWVLNGHKWFTSNASIADILIVMAVTNPDVHPYQGSSMFVVPADAPGVNILRDVPTMADPDHEMGQPGGHAEILYEDVRVPFDHIVGGEDGIGQGFALAQKRLGPGRIHHAMRWLGQGQRAFDMMCERALSRYTHGSTLAEKQMVQDWIAESYAERQAARLLTLHAAWTMDELHAAGKHYSDARLEIGVIKFWGAKVLYNVIDRSIQIHGSLGYTTDLPLESMYRAARAARIYDGPDEVHKVTVARQILKRYRASDPSLEHVPTRRAAAIEKFADELDALSLSS
jgi:acyl-CoA dehydrogenase